MIAASDYPHGIFEFTRELNYVDESFFENHPPAVDNIIMKSSTNVSANYAYVGITRRNGRLENVCIHKFTNRFHIGY